MPGSPCHQSLRGALRPFVAANCCRLAPPLDNLIKRSYPAQRWQQKTHLNPRTFCVMVISDIQYSNRAAIAQSIRHETHVPNLIRGPRHIQFTRIIAPDSTARIYP